MKGRIENLGGVLLGYLEDTRVRMTRREIEDLLSRVRPAPVPAEVETVLKRLCAEKRLVRVGTIKASPDRDDGVYCLPDRAEGSAIVDVPGKAAKRSRFSVARGAPSSDLTRRQPAVLVEGHGAIKTARKPLD